jgi:hypothetical protein
MRSDVHSAALEAAAKVAFSVALLNGCSGADALGDRSVAEDDEAISDEAAIVSSGSKRSGSKKPSPEKLCPDASAETDATPTGTDAGQPSCDAVLAAAFPTPGDYQWKPVAQSKEVVACCDEELTKSGAMSTYRWDCCVAYDPASTPDPQSGFTNPNHGMACTPWGPPVPPSMNRARRTATQAVA